MNKHASKARILNFTSPEVRQWRGTQKKAEVYQWAVVTNHDCGQALWGNKPYPEIHQVQEKVFLRR